MLDGDELFLVQTLDLSKKFVDFSLEFRLFLLSSKRGEL